MTIIWCVVLEIWRATDIIFCHSGMFFALLPPYGSRKSKFWKNEKNTPEGNIILQMCTVNASHMTYGSWDTECNGQNFLSLLTIVCPFTLPPLTTQKLKFWKNEKNTLRYYHFTGVYHKWQSHAVWFPRFGDRQNFLSFWTVFCPFTPLTTWKIKFCKKLKTTPGDIIILHICTTNDNDMMYGFYTCVP